MQKAIFLFIIILILLNPVYAAVFVSEPSNGIITAPAASFTNNHLIFSNKNPAQAVLNYLNGKEAIIVGDISLNGQRIAADSAKLSKFWRNSDTIVLGTGKDTSSALLAIKNNAPLLVAGNSVPDSVNNEIQRLKPKRIIICADRSSISDSVLKKYPNSERYWKGSDRETLKDIKSGNREIKAPESLLPVAMTIWKDANFDMDDEVTVDGRTTLWSSNDITTSIVMNRYAINNIPVIFITCDNMISEDADRKLLQKIKEAISGSAEVRIDSESPKPGEAPRAVQNAPEGTTAYIAAADPGSMTDLVIGIKEGYLKKDAQKLDGIVYINYGRLNLENTSFLSRAWDDNYSNAYFAGLYTPSSFLNGAGIRMIQPDAGTNSEDEEINKIAMGLIDTAYSSNKAHLNPNYNAGAITKHDIHPKFIAYGSQRILNNREPEMGTSMWLYLTSQYVGGLPIRKTSDRYDDVEIKESNYFGVITRDEYRILGEKTYKFMKANKTVPDSITVDGKKLDSGDMEYLFAVTTEEHTSKENMQFSKYVYMNAAYEPFQIIYKFIRSSFYSIFS